MADSCSALAFYSEEMGFHVRLRTPDEQMAANAAVHMRRRTALRMSIGLGLFAALCLVGSYIWDDGLARMAVPIALVAGMVLGRIQEHDITAKRGHGLKPDSE
jgi:hypothetical protein